MRNAARAAIATVRSTRDVMIISVGPQQMNRQIGRSTRKSLLQGS
jgi:hypothetical protein